MEKGISFSEIGLLYAIREIVINIIEIPTGIFADIFGRKSSLVGSFIAYIFSFITFYLSSGFWLFLIAFLLYGIGDAFRSGTHKGMIMSYLKLNNWEDQKINYYGHTRSWSQKGSALSSLFAGGIVFYSGTYQYIFLFSIVPYLINLFLILSYPQVLNRSSKSTKGRAGIIQTFRSFLIIIKRKKVFGIMVTSAVFSAYLRAVKDYIQPLLIHIAILIPILLNYDSTKKNGVIIGVIYFFIYLLSSKASQLASTAAKGNKPTIANVTLISGFVFGIICGVFFKYEFWILSLLSFVGIFIIENLRKPILTGFIADDVPNELLSSVISAQSLLKTLITAILALTFGIVADVFGIGMSFIIVTSLLLISVLLIKKAK